MSQALQQHQVEIEKNLAGWNSKPLLQQLYTGFYRRILTQVDASLPGRVVELGSGIGNLKAHWPRAIGTDLFPNPWVDLSCDAYDLPFQDGSLSHLLLFDVFHHLEWPAAFLQEARRVLVERGRVILFEPFISWGSFPAYGIFHHEPVAWRHPIRQEVTAPLPRRYYAAQGNATRLFFRGDRSIEWGAQWKALKIEAFSAFAYLLSGGYSKPALYPGSAEKLLQGMDQKLSAWPRLFGGRCLVVLEKKRIG